MNWTLVSLHHVAPQPWRNGGGSTRELLAWPGPADWRVRISVADVDAAGPFSRFKDIERWFAVLEGAGVALDIGGVVNHLTPAGAPLKFGGSKAVGCSLLGGPTRDLNLMAAPGRARMQRVEDTLACTPTQRTLLALYAHSRPARIVQGSSGLEVPAGHLAWGWQDAGATLRVTGEHAFWMEALA